MKHFLLFFALLPGVLCAQTIYEDPRAGYIAPYDNLSSITVTAFAESRKDSILDSVFVNVNRYAEDGRMSEQLYRAILDKAIYHEETHYQYRDDMFMKLSYTNGKLYDSVIVAGDSAWRYYSGRLKHAYAGDTVREISTNDGKPVYDVGRCLSCRDTFWDYKNNGRYARKVITAAPTTDTVRYFDDKGVTMVMFVNYYSESRHVILTEYYNYTCKAFEFRRYRYNVKYDLTFFMEKSKKGKPSYTVSRKYDEEGRLTEERLAGTNRKAGTLVLKYTYAFY